MIKKKGYMENEMYETVEYDYYEPESPLKEASNIQEVLEPLRFEILGFRNKYSNYEYILHLKFVTGIEFPNGKKAQQPSSIKLAAPNLDK